MTDPHCRVIGTQGLRVIDASIMPVLVGANPYLAVLMIAEKMAAELATYGKRTSDLPTSRTSVQPQNRIAPTNSSLSSSNARHTPASP